MTALIFLAMQIHPCIITQFLTDHIKEIDEDVLEEQRGLLKELIRSRYEIKETSLKELFALSQKIEQELFGRKSFVREIRGNAAILFYYSCPFKETAKRFPEICKIAFNYYTALGEVCGWEIKDFNPIRHPSKGDDYCEVELKVEKRR
jgi:predicted ArsR family transcriptional regulator